jgi:hypothetical protein
MEPRALDGFPVGADDAIASSPLIPVSFTVLRAELIPVVVALAHLSPRPVWFALCLSAGMLAEILLGFCTPQLLVAKSGVRRLCGLVDLLLSMAGLYATWILYPDVVRLHSGAIAALVVLHGARYALDFGKFGREAAYYTWFGKAWAVMAFLGMFGVLVGGARGDWLMSAAIAMGIVASIEALLISIVLPVQHAGVPTLAHALHIRRVALRYSR